MAYVIAGQGGMQADKVLERERRVGKELHLDPAGNRKWTVTLGMA